MKLFERFQQKKNKGNKIMKDVLTLQGIALV